VLHGFLRSALHLEVGSQWEEREPAPAKSRETTRKSSKKIEVFSEFWSNAVMPYEFGPFRLDTEAEILFRGDKCITVGQRAVALLRVLVEHAGTPVSKDALIESAWAGLAVEESNLTVQIAALRRVLASEPGGERWIETLPRRGYRFVGPVSPRDGSDDLPAERSAEAAPALPLPDKPSVAVLPFDNLSGDREQEYFADGLAEDIISGLSKFHGLFVIARNSSFTYKGRSVEVKQVGRELGVRYILEGGVRKAANRVRVSVQLIDALTGGHVWAERYDRDLEDIFALQDELTEAIVGAVAPSFITAEAQRVERKPPESLDAWDCAMRANWHFARRNRQDNAEARRLFERALEIDAKNTAALNGLAFTLGLAITFGWADDLDEARAALNAAGQRAVVQDAKDAEAYVALATGHFALKQLDSAAAACHHALELNPNLAVAEGWLAFVLSWRGDYDEALRHAEKAARLSPYDPTYSWWGIARTSAVFGAGRYREAVEWARKTIEVTPEFPAGWRYLAASLAHLGHLEEARAAKDQLLQVMPHDHLRLVRAGLPSVNRDRMDRFVDGLRKAGVPD
jgi:TolB-like protein/Flp pilus assembly protein TadD